MTRCPQPSELTVELSTNDRGEKNEGNDHAWRSPTRPIGRGPLSVAFTSQVSGGTPGYTYLWDFGDGSTSAAADPTHVFATVGSFTVTLTVHDSLGVQKTYTKTVTVNAAPPANGGLGSLGDPTTLLILGVIVAAAVIAIAVVLIVRRRKRVPAAVPPPPPPPA